MIRFVTLTGADDSVSPSHLFALSEKYPFVEWGILVGSGFGKRFPSKTWIADLIEARCDSGNRMNLSLHICGKFLREIAGGCSTLMDEFGMGIAAFDRCQLNWHGERQGAIEENILKAFCQDLMPWEPEIIFQLDGVNDHLASAAMRRFRCSGLFDLSHGAGILPDEWPEPRIDMGCGYAGGLGPDNIEDQQHRIASVARGNYWIDMETKLRTGRAFDLEKCESVLVSMQDHVEDAHAETI